MEEIIFFFGILTRSAYLILREFKYTYEEIGGSDTSSLHLTHWFILNFTKAKIGVEFQSTLRKQPLCRAERGRRRGGDLGSTLASCWVRRQWRSQQLQFGAGLAAWKNSDGVVVEASSLGSEKDWARARKAGGAWIEAMVAWSGIGEDEHGWLPKSDWALIGEAPMSLRGGEEARHHGGAAEWVIDFDDSGQRCRTRIEGKMEARVCAAWWFALQLCL
ncbi:hypothetical protein M0R45_035985 [Rubus argutus]|uniref:Uncharacterized protein n=1 Tax=Rubus argutus TaxID=59490 RepID=A0AAW1VYK9_RUBAR